MMMMMMMMMMMLNGTLCHSPKGKHWEIHLILKPQETIDHNHIGQQHALLDKSFPLVIFCLFISMYNCLYIFVYILCTYIYLYILWELPQFPVHTSPKKEIRIGPCFVQQDRQNGESFATNTGWGQDPMAKAKAKNTKRWNKSEHMFKNRCLSTPKP